MHIAGYLLASYLENSDESFLTRICQLKNKAHKYYTDTYTGFIKQGCFELHKS